MNKKIAIILALMITSTATLLGCGSSASTESSSVPDTTFEVSGGEEDIDDTNSIEDSEANTDKTEAAENKNNTASTTNTNNKTENKTTQNTTTNNKNNTSSTNNTTSSTKNEQTTTTTKKSKTYTAQAGYTLTFPASWEGKYVVEEKTDALIVRYKLSKDTTSENPYLFSIEKYNPNEEYDHFDTVGNIRTFNVGDTKYIVGGPTGLSLSEDSKDFKDYIDIATRCSEVTNSIKVIK